MNAQAMPTNWSRRRLRFDARANPVKSELTLSDDAEVSFVPMDAVGELGGLRLEEIKPIADVYTGYTYFRDGDICIAKITPCFENGKGALACGLTNGVAFGTTELHIVRPLATLDAKFLFYISIAQDFRNIGEAEMLGAGGQKRVPERFIKDWRAPLPPLETQKRIAAFLDEKTAQIDGLIAKKQALVERLAEKRQAVITQAVTKGLNPNTPMKPSGIDWLGDVPTHWEVWPLRRMVASATYGISEALSPEGEVAILRMGNLQDCELDLSDLRYVEHVDPDLLLRTDDVIFNRTNSLDLVGKSAIYRGDYKGNLSLASYLVRFRMNDRLSPEYAVLAMNLESLLCLARTYALPSIGQANLSPGRYSALSFPLPPRAEQAEITHFVEVEMGKLRSVERQIARSSLRLTEYRSALITAAVTGQIEGLR